MIKYIKITIFTLVCVCFNINKMYACDQYPIPVMTSVPDVNKLYIGLKDTLTLTFDNNSYDPDNGTDPGDGIVAWDWTLQKLNGSGLVFGLAPNSSFVFDPNTLGFDPNVIGLEPGLYSVDINVCDDEGNWYCGYDYKGDTGSWSGIRYIYVLDIDYLWDDIAKDTYVPYGTGNTFYYSLSPDPNDWPYYPILNWEPDILTLYIKDTEGNYAYLDFTFGSMKNISLTGSKEWDGLGDYGSYDNQPLPPGNYTLTLNIRKQGTNIKKAIPQTIYKVTNIEWKKYLDNWNLGTDEEGITIFPDKKYYNDPNTDRDRVKVEATITPPLPNKNVYFSWWDVDDPCGNSIDTKPEEHPNTGPDNFGGTNVILTPTNITTNTNGKAIVDFYVTKQPGDNFRIAASTYQNALNDITCNSIERNDPNTWPSGVYFSPRLTVYRHLWIEQDSMKSVNSAGYIISEDFSSGKPGSPVWDYYSSNNGNIQVVNGRLRLDDSVADNSSSLNEAILHFNYTDMTNARLILDHNNLADEPNSMPASFTGHNNCDGIALSIDGEHWIRITNLTNSFTNQYFYLNNVISQAITAAGSIDVNDVQIKFQQYDNTYEPNDGREFDNILLIVYKSEKNFVWGINAVYGQYNAVNNTTVVHLGGILPNEFDDLDHFENGTYVVGGNRYQVKSSTAYHSINDHIVVQGNATGNGPCYVLYDDDWVWNPTSMKMVPEVNLPHYCSLGSYANAFRAAYIEPIELSAYHTLVDFDRNLTDWDFTMHQGSWDDGQEIHSSVDFWACTVVACYQEGANQDIDPDTDPATTGLVPDYANIATIYLETIRDNHDDESLIIAHEIGHTGGLHHGTTSEHEDYIMGYEHGIYPKKFDLNPFAEQFHPDHIKIMRSNTVWSQ